MRGAIRISSSPAYDAASVEGLNAAIGAVSFSWTARTWPSHGVDAIEDIKRVMREVAPHMATLSQAPPEAKEPGELAAACRCRDISLIALFAARMPYAMCCVSSSVKIR